MASPQTASDNLKIPAFLDRREMFKSMAADELPPPADKSVTVPIVPVPSDAPRVNYRHPEHGEPGKAWAYHDRDGGLVGYVCRWDFDGGKDFRPVTYCRLPDGDRGWRAKGFPEPRPLFGLPDILANPDAAILVVEGEKARDAAAGVFPDLIATTPPHGAQSPHKTDWAPVAGRHVVVWPDNDEAGAELCRGCLAPLCGLGSGFCGDCAGAARLPDKMGLGGRAARRLDR